MPDISCLKNCLLMGLLLTAAVATAASVTPTTPAELPADGVITLTDYGYRDWGPEPISYPLAGKWKPGAFEVVDAEGNPVPFQVDGQTLTFIASVPNGGTSRYTLREAAAAGQTSRSTLRVTTAGQELVAANEFLEVHMPAPGKREFQPAAAAQEATPPILRWAPAGTAPVGGARFVTARKVTNQAFSIVRQGAALFEYEARYRFEPQGEYVWRLRLSPGRPLAIVTEEFDFGAITGGEDLLMLDLHAGWKPENVAWVNGAGEQQLPNLGKSGFDAYVESKRTAQAAEAPVGGVGAAPTPYKPEDDLVLLELIYPGGRWGALKGGIQVWDGDPDQPGEGRSLGLVPLHTGSWRRSMSLVSWYKPGVGITVGLPISVRYSRWSLDVTDDHSPFSTHEHDPGLSPTYGRRVWGLLVGPGMETAQARYGYVGLDRYKNWIIERPEPANLDRRLPATYPGAFFSPEQVAKLKPVLDQHPDAEYLRTWYLFSGRTEDAVSHAQRVIDGLKRPYGENDFFLVALSNYRKSQFLAFVNLAEDALACPDLPVDLWRELRRRLTLYAYVMSDPDFNPRGAGCHLGNNNMPINRTLALSYFAGLLPDHPCYDYWMQCVRDFVAFKYGTQFAPDGPKIECPSYALYSPFRTLNISQNILRNRGIYDFGPEGYHEGFLRWLSNLSMADPRWDGYRIIPGMGNSSNQFENFWGFSMAAHADRDVKFAGWLRFMNRLANGDMKLEPGPNGHDRQTPHAMYYLPYIPENPEPLVTTFMPTYGVAFRHQFNTPNETAMLFRAGMNWGHWDPDPLNVILYGKGAPLSPGTEYQYFSGEGPWSNNGIYHNQVKVGARDLQEVFGRVDGAISDYGFGAHADYAVADRFYPSQIFRDGQGAMWWRRHVLFVKTDLTDGPSYFVMRDTFPGGERRPTWWNWMNLETPDRISVDGKFFGPDAVINQTIPEEQMPAQQGQTVEMRTDYGASTWFWFSEPRTVRIRMIAEYVRQDGKGGHQKKTVVEIPGQPGQDYFYAVYPRRDGEGTPTCQALAPGVMRITTSESEDTVFLGDVPFAWDRDGLVFTGKAGAVRVYADRVALCLNAGSGRVGYKGYVLEGHGPFERVVKLADLKPGVQQVTGGYAKQVKTEDLGRGVRISGEGPFTARLDGETITIRTQGRSRVLFITQPEFIVRPQYWVDGRQWMACWTDYPASGWGTYDNSWLIGLSVPEGEHELVVRDMQFPPVWARPFTPLIEGVVRD